MRKFILLIVICILGCDSHQFPNSINSSITDDHFRIKGTRLFVKNIDEFVFYPGSNVFKKSDSVSIQCLVSDINYSQNYVNQSFDFLYNNDYEIEQKQEFQINEFQGVFYKLKEQNLNYLYFIFGDSHIENKIIAVFPENETYERTFFKFIKSIYYDKDYDLDIFEDVRFDFDLLESRYKFVSFSSNTYLFYEDIGDFSIRPNSIFFTQTTANEDSIIQRKAIDNMIYSLKNSGLQINDVVYSNHVKIDSFSTLTSEVDGILDNKPFYIRYIFASNGEYSLIYGTSLYNEIESSKDLINKIFETVKL